jgi:hypothetical protein
MRFVALIQRNSGAHKQFRLIALALILILGSGAIHADPQSSAQPSTAAIFGYVLDAENAVIPKAAITLKTPWDPPLQAIADENGHFAIRAKPGYYTLMATSPGFSTHQESIHLADATSIKKDIVLQVGHSGCGVCVTRAAAPIETLDTSLTSTLPLNPLPPLKLHKPTAR